MTKGFRYGDIVSLLKELPNQDETYEEFENYDG